MTRLYIASSCPMTVQFWLFGLDARAGDLARLGYVRRPAPPAAPHGPKGQGSSVYACGHLRLHSAGLSAELPQGELRFERRTGRFWLGGERIGRERGSALALPLILHHEARLCRLHAPDWRRIQLRAHALPAPVRRALPAWTAARRGLDAHLWTPAGRPDVYGAPVLPPVLAP